MINDRCDIDITSSEVRNDSILAWSLSTSTGGKDSSCELAGVDNMMNKVIKE